MLIEPFCLSKCWVNESLDFYIFQRAGEKPIAMKKTAYAFLFLVKQVLDVWVHKVISIFTFEWFSPIVGEGISTFLQTVQLSKEPPCPELN
uniref:Uncharacterized protein n=1 Tax=Pyxicephalus adspersus TaxID=30357 RepID=A0AAV2ZVE1_PYXAD|nr:TPA: hypothetical protein GDO54_016835 [Pyxicephalus adspersus]